MSERPRRYQSRREFVEDLERWVRAEDDVAHRRMLAERLGLEQVELTRPGRPGRPPGLTTIQSDDAIRVAVLEMRRAGRQVTMATVAAQAGYTLAELRGYLRVTHRTWREFLSGL